MNYIKTVMELYPPHNWSKDFVYDHQRFILVDIQDESDEYRDVGEHFRSVFRNASPIRVQRVQHPFAYLRFQIHKESLSKYGYNFTETIRYQEVNKAFIETYLDSGCDLRRCTNSTIIDCNGIISTVQPNTRSSAVYVREKYIKDNYFKERDSNTMPEYIIAFK